MALATVKHSFRRGNCRLGASGARRSLNEGPAVIESMPWRVAVFAGEQYTVNWLSETPDPWTGEDEAELHEFLKTEV